jgi:hypothetical protein
MLLQAIPTEKSDALLEALMNYTLDAKQNL